MARSTYIYVVMRDSDVVSAFTVKHEMLSWLRKNPTPARVWRLADGGGYATKPPTEITDELQITE